MDGALFADNLAIYIATRRQRVTKTALQGVTNKLDAWVAERGLTFSPSKTVSMVFRIRIRRKRNKEPNYALQGFLRIPLDSRLNWEEHIARTLDII